MSKPVGCLLILGWQLIGCAHKELDECMKLSTEMFELLVTQEEEIAELQEARCHAKFNTK